MGTVGLRECHLVGEERTTKSEEAKCVKAILHDAIQKAGQREAVKKTFKGEGERPDGGDSPLV